MKVASISDLKDLLGTIGYDQLVDDGRFWRTNAIYRNGDNKTSLRINKSSGDWKDFVEQRHGTIEDLVKLTLNLGDVEFKQFCEGNRVDINALVLKKEKPLITMDKTFDESVIANLLPHYKFYEDKGISKETLKFFRSGLDHSGSMNQRYVFPIYGQDGKIQGLSGRDMTGKRDAKWKHMGRKANWLYPLWMPKYNLNAVGEKAPAIYPCREAILKKREVILVESIGDMLALWEYGVYNVLVTFGLDILPKLGSFLMTLDLDRIVIAFNNDFESDINRGRNGAIKAYIDLMHYVDFAKLNICLPASNDFGDADSEDMNEWQFAVAAGPNKELHNEILQELRHRYKTRTITSAEVKFGKALSNLYDQS